MNGAPAPNPTGRVPAIVRKQTVAEILRPKSVLRNQISSSCLNCRSRTELHHSATAAKNCRTRARDWNVISDAKMLFS